MKIFVFILCIFFISSCGSEIESVDYKSAIVGEWRITNLDDLNERHPSRKDSQEDFVANSKIIETFTLNGDYNSAGIRENGEAWEESLIYRFKLHDVFEYMIKSHKNQPVWFTGKILSMTESEMVVLNSNIAGEEIGLTRYERINE